MMKQAEDTKRLEERKARFFYGRHVHFSVRPRYSGGSPAMVSERIAMGVAEDEKRSYEHDLEGIHGEQKQQRAQILGLSGIVYAQKESGRGKKFRWHRWDLITDEETKHLDDEGLRREGYVTISELPEFIRNGILVAGVGQTGDAKDYERRWYKYTGLAVIEYKAELIRE